METFMAAYVVVGIGLATYVLHLRSNQRHLEQRTRVLEARVVPVPSDATQPRSVNGG